MVHAPIRRKAHKKRNLRKRGYPQPSQGFERALRFRHGSVLRYDPLRKAVQNQSGPASVRFQERHFLSRNAVFAGDSAQPEAGNILLAHHPIEQPVAVGQLSVGWICRFYTENHRCITSFHLQRRTTGSAFFIKAAETAPDFRQTGPLAVLCYKDNMQTGQFMSGLKRFLQKNILF